jgi:hypothetical protein
VGRTLAIGAGVAAVVAVLAGSAASSDIYITGTVLGRVDGQYAANVRIAWDYKCLGEDGGDYEWTLKVVRMQPLPEKTTVLGKGTGERGERTVRLTPGRYLPKSDPYLCETSRGQGFDKPEIGASFAVPDYCAWTVASVRGLVQHEQGSAVKAARAGSSIARGDALVTPRNGNAVLNAVARDGKATLGGGTHLQVDAKHCPAKSGWKLLLADGKLTVAVTPAASAKASFSTLTDNAIVFGTRLTRWDISFAAGKTTVRALAGTVRVAGKRGAPLRLKAGQSATVKGSGPPVR